MSFATFIVATKWKEENKVLIQLYKQYQYNA